MTIVLVYGPMNMGGIETLIVRLWPILANNGHRVRLLCQPGTLDLAGVEPEARAFYTDWEDAHAIARRWAEGAAHVAFVSFDPTSCALTGGLRSIASGSSHVTGVYHPHAWFLEDDPVRLFINRMLLATITDRGIFFINEESRTAHAAWAKRGFEESAIIPLAVTVHEERRPEPSERFRIVSVGRLTAFKDYAVHAPRLASELAMAGYDVEWDIYGTGELGATVRAEIDRHDASAQVRLKGHLPYQEFSGIGARYDAFVGMGTAALEAATLGMPTIVPAFDSGDRTYGYLHDLPFGNVGELQDTPPGKSVGDLLQAVVAASADERAALGAQSRAAATRYSMENYAAALIDVIRLAGRTNSLHSRIASFVYRETSIGNARRMLSALRTKWRR